MQRMRIFVTGATGLVGTRIVQSLLQEQHELIILTRNAARACNHFKNNAALKIIEDDVTKTGDWQTIAGECDVIVHLAGAGIMDKRWTKSYKKLLWSSRIDSTHHVAQIANNLLICASATGLYGDCGDQQLTEENPAGNGFLSDLCNEWESEACSANCRVVCLRFGIILDIEGGALAKMLPLFKIGMGGPIGSGRQYWPWIAWQDVCQIVHQAIAQDWTGAINAVAPEQVTCKEFAKTLGGVLRRPSIMKVPSFALRLLVGEGSCVLTGSQRVTPSMLIQNGYQFQYPTLRESLDELLGSDYP